MVRGQCMYERLTLSDRSWMYVSDERDEPTDGKTNLASEVSTHVGGWLVVDSR